LYRATVRGVADVTVFIDDNGYGHHATVIGDSRHSDRSWITDARPLIVLDLEYPQIAVRALEMAFRDHTNGDARTIYRSIADQIEAQTKPARIPEPEKWGVVYARLVNASIWESWLRHPGEGWHPIRGGVATRWDDLIDPVLIREGVES